MVKRVLVCLLTVCLLLGCCAFGASAEGDATVTVVDITWNGAEQPKPGANVVFSAHLKNSGTADVAKGTAVSVALYINQEKVFTQNYDKGIAAGATVQVKFPKWEAVEGEHVVTAVLGDMKPDRLNWLEHQHLAANIRVAKEALEVPEVAEKYGMTNLTFSDDFTTLDSVDKECSGAYGYKWYANLPFGGKDAEPTDYKLTADGISVERKPTLFSWTLCTLDAATGAGWGYVHGYMEMRIRTPGKRLSGEKGSPAVWSLPPEKILSLPASQRHYVETDFLEFAGDEFYTTTLHDLHFANKLGTEYIRWDKNSNNEYMGLRDDEWHTMGFVRQNGVMRCYLDGKEYMTLYWAEGEKSYPEATLLKGGDGIDAFTIVDKQLTPLVLHGAENWPLEVDYIRVWEGDEETNQGESIEAAQFVDAHLRDDDGQINLTPDFENYEALIDMETAFSELSAERQKELDAVAKREVDKTMAQVVSDAKQFKADMEAFVAAYATDSEGEVLDAASLDACQMIVKGERKWNKMSAELKEAVNTKVFLKSSATTYDELLAAAREKVPASPIKAWMIVLAAAVVVLAAAGIVIGVRCKKAKEK